MGRIRVFGRSAWLLAGVFVSLAGCSGGGPPGQPQGGAAGAKAGADLESKFGDYMPPLDGGRLEIAVPKGWDWANPGGRALVAFKPRDAEINELPRVLLSVADAGLFEIDDVTAENTAEFIKQLAGSIAEQKPKEAVRAVTINGRPFARYQLLAKRRNQVVVQRILTTVAASRVYTLRLEAYQAELDKSESALDVIAASMKFAAGGESAGTAPAGEPGKAEAVMPDEASGDPKEPAAAQADE